MRRKAREGRPATVPFFAMKSPPRSNRLQQQPAEVLVAKGVVQHASRLGSSLVNLEAADNRRRAERLGRAHPPFIAEGQWQEVAFRFAFDILDPQQHQGDGGGGPPDRNGATSQTVDGSNRPVLAAEPSPRGKEAGQQPLELPSGSASKISSQSPRTCSNGKGTSRPASCPPGAAASTFNVAGWQTLNQ